MESVVKELLKFSTEQSSLPVTRYVVANGNELI